MNNSFSNSRNGWGASAADALSTAIVMELPHIVNEIIDYIPTIDWSHSYDDEVVSLFETTIRYLGGMLSGYDLLSGPLAHLANNKKNVNALLKQAENLANHLSYAFDTPTGIPSNNLFFGNRSTDGSTTNGLATIGTLVLEWTHLSDLSGNQTYGELARKGESYLLHPKPVMRHSVIFSTKQSLTRLLHRLGLNHGQVLLARMSTSIPENLRMRLAGGTAVTTVSTNIC